MTTKVSGIEPGQRRLNGPQTTGRDYRNLSPPEYEMARDNDVAVPMRDGVTLLADVYRPAKPGRYPVLVAASAYPRQIQDLGAPAGFIEAGQSDFFVPRGYVHVVANVRGTSGSGGTFGFFDGQERRDMHDLVEWAAAQPWSDGNVGMIGISYFAMTQLEAAVERPPHLKAIFPVAVTTDLYEAALHHGLVSSSFVTPFLAMVGMTSGQSNELWRGKLLGAARHILRTPALHKKFETANGEAAMTGLRILLKLHHEPHPWDDLWRAVVVEHPVRDAWWDDRNLQPLLHKVAIPVYLGCDWDNVPLHLPSTFEAYRALTSSPHVRVAMLATHGLSWPWESLHVEALAWFDHWLKGRDTGILEGPPIRYRLPGADEWRTADHWPPRAIHRELALRADGALDDSEGQGEGEAGARAYMTLGAGLNRARVSAVDPPSNLTWTSAPLERELDVVGHVELRLDASSTALDTAWIVILQDVDTAGHASDVTAGYLRASLREVDEAASRPGAPVVPCRKPEVVPIGEVVHYRLPLVANARRFPVGHRIQVYLTSDDQDQATPAIMSFRHASVGTSSLNTVYSSSRLLLPILSAE
jgi:predicted acyl esterase